MVASTGNISTVAGNGYWSFWSPSTDGNAATSTAIRYPIDVAVDASGNLFMAQDAQILIVAAGTGILSTFTATIYPRGLAVAANGDILCAVYCGVFR